MTVKEDISARAVRKKDGINFRRRLLIVRFFPDLPNSRAAFGAPDASPPGVGLRSGALLSLIRFATVAHHAAASVPARRFRTHKVLLYRWRSLLLY